METITMPSPSAFLASPMIKPAPEPPPPKRRPTTLKSAIVSPKKTTGVVKPKQSKSRNGCITCKAKRLKCDETKPSCQQCHKRSVTCGGYKKDFKWRSFEETAFIKATPKPKRNSIVSRPPDSQPTTSPSDVSTFSPDRTEHDGTVDSFTVAPTPASTPPNTFAELHFDPVPMFDMNSPPYMRELPRPRFEARSLNSLFEDSPRPILSGQSPRLVDLLLPGSEINAGSIPVTENDILPLSIDLAPIDPFLTSMSEALEDIEEIIREPQLLEPDTWMVSPMSPNPYRVDPFFKLYRQPEPLVGSPDMLMLRFDKQTCGILSVKDGPTENPWRTLIWPLARDSPALYHAIASMTAFHTCKEKPALRVDGMEHMRQSISALATGLRSMRTDTALATTLALAFSESWDQHVSTGIEHLRGAKVLVNHALVSYRQQNLSGDDLARLRFLCNTWIYMDVIARLTSFNADDSNDFEEVLSTFNHLPMDTEIDPLMGCASTLFPLIGKVANLCRRVRKTETNSIAVISQAIELKEMIVQWSPPTLASIDRAEDPCAEAQHALQTAEAYRYAILLYLHQAVPELPSWTSAQLSNKVLKFLATVPLSSSLVIVQIFPLLAAGCEAEGEDRHWVKERWLSMSKRMLIGNIDRCLDVVQEVWHRRDGAQAARQRKAKARPVIIHSESLKRKFEEEMSMESFQEMLNSKRQRASFGNAERKRVHEPAEEEMEKDLTVRGKLHWVGVMKDWKWEILLG